MISVGLKNLPTSTAFAPTMGRGWFIQFWEIRIADIFVAFPFAILLTVLFYFDHNGKYTLPMSLFGY
jgi:boron transporter